MNLSPKHPFLLTFHLIRPQYKRIAAFKGDLTFEAPRRHLLKYMSQAQRTWGFREPIIRTLLCPPLRLAQAS